VGASEGSDHGRFDSRGIATPSKGRKRERERDSQNTVKSEREWNT